MTVWMLGLKDSAFSLTALKDSWKICKIGDMIESLAGSYIKASIIGGRSIRKTGIIEPGTFTVGTFFKP